MTKPNVDDPDTWNPKLNHGDILRAAEEEMFGDSSSGFCIACGNEQDGCEPDAREYECESCGEHMVYGAAELMLRLE